MFTAFGAIRLDANGSEFKLLGHCALAVRLECTQLISTFESDRVGPHTVHMRCAIAARVICNYAHKNTNSGRLNASI